MTKQFVAYYRVSTKRQGRSGLGIEAQEQSVAILVANQGAKLIGSFKEHESGKQDRNRPELHKAIAMVKRRKAVLVIARLDRLSRNAAFLLNLRDSGIEFRCCDMPEADATTVGFMAIMAEHTGRLISRNTKEALAAAKRRGVRLGNRKGVNTFGAAGQEKGSRNGASATRQKALEAAEGFRDLIQDIRREGITSASGIARHLNEKGETTPRGKAWNPMQVIRTMDRLGLHG